METKIKWTIDPGHSQIQFKVKHLAIANVAGRFKTFNGYALCEQGDLNHAQVYFEIDTNSIDTNNPERDQHLRSDLFLNIDKFPKITFRGTLTQEQGNYTLSGDLTILETTKTVTFDVEHTGTGTGRFGDTRAGFELSGSIHRKDFGLNFNLATEVGNLVVGETVKIQCDVELIRQ
jgi:polyisoprenoid-binding protein YceI